MMAVNGIIAPYLDKGGAVYNVKAFGATGDGATDDAAAIQNALDAIPAGSTLVFPPGVYVVSSPLGWTGKQLHIEMNGATIVYGREQSGTPSYDDSLFVVSEADGSTFRGGKLQYTGTFDHGSSYAGFVSGIYLNESDDILIEEVEATGFNRAGISVGVGDGFAYCNRVTVRGCHLHHNRVAGVLFGDVNDFTLDDCDLHFNGLDSDNGTGYGSASWSTKNPVDAKVVNCRANDNYRKGIDFHSGRDGTVSGCTTARNKYYGIFVGNVTGTWTVTGNLIRAMVDDSAQGVHGLHFGPDDAQAPGTIPTIGIIADNIFEDLDEANGVGTIFVFTLYLGTLQQGHVSLRGNIINVGTVSRLVQVAASAGGGFFDLAIDDNQWNADEVRSSPFSVLPALSRKKSFSGNKVTIAEPLSVANVYTYAATTVPGNAWHAHGNDMTLTSALAWSVDPLIVRRVAQERLSANTLNGAPLRDWDGRRYVASASAMPSEGFWSAGSYVANVSKSVQGTAGSRYVINGWQRLTSGTDHVDGTDWIQDRGLTGT